MLKGIGASPGIAIGKVLLKKDEKIEIEKKNINNTEIEIDRFNDARDTAKEQIQELHRMTLETIGETEAKIFEAHRMILDDPDFLQQIESEIKSQEINAEYAIKKITDAFIQIFENIEDEYMKERAADIKDVSNRLINILQGVETADLSNLDEEAIIVSEDLTPSDTAQMDKSKVLGFVTEVGGRTSHSAIMARTLEIPAVVGVDGITEAVNDGDIVIFDGDEGKIYINPEDSIIEKYKNIKKRYEKFREKLEEIKGAESVTKDGFKVELAGNIGTPQDLEAVLRNDGEGIGLYRTEFLYMDRDSFPNEEEQFEAYKAVAEGMNGKPVVIRTLDIGGDKELSYLDLPEEMNPFLGYRAIRLCLDKTDIFITQLRAILRASNYGNIKIMFPMISSIEELRQAKEILDNTKYQLRKEGVKFDENIEVGMMVEIPAVAVMSDLFAKEVDFFSIGTNDLIQYTTAVDRMNQKISHLYNQFHPALLRLIKQVIDNGHKENIWVGMCGEVAGDPKLIPILIGMGLNEFSMSPISILKARWLIRDLSQKDMKEMVEKVINLPTAEEVKNFIDENIK